MAETNDNMTNPGEPKWLPKYSPPEKNGGEAAPVYDVGKEGKTDKHADRRQAALARERVRKERYLADIRRAASNSFS